MTTVLLLDYGGVLNRPVDRARLAKLADDLGVEPRAFGAAFDGGRLAFDLGQPPGDFWAGVAGRPLSTTELALATAVDLALWGDLDPVSVAAVQRAAAAGMRPVLLSNMPHPEADAYESLPWTEPFERLFFSCRLGLAKPDPAIFRHVIAELGVAPAEITFLDDRADNVAAARQLVIDARVCDGGEALSAAVETLIRGARAV